MQENNYYDYDKKLQKNMYKSQIIAFVICILPAMIIFLFISIFDPGLLFTGNVLSILFAIALVGFIFTCIRAKYYFDYMDKHGAAPSCKLFYRIAGKLDIILNGEKDEKKGSVIVIIIGIAMFIAKILLIF